MKAKKYIWKKEGEVNKDAFADLLLQAKGGRTMKDFAEICGVNPSTFTRIIQRSNKGASSSELLEAIAANAVPNSGVTIKKLADANGYSITEDIGLKVNMFASLYDKERLVREILSQALIDRGQLIRIGRIRYEFSKSLSLSPDSLIMTDAFGTKDGVWFADSILATPRFTNQPDKIHASRLRHTAFERIARFIFISQNPIELFRPCRYSLVVCEREAYNIIVEEFSETYVPTEVSIILIDTLNSCIEDEYVLPRTGVGHIESYFMTTNIIPDDRDYLRAEYDEEGFDD